MAAQTKRDVQPTKAPGKLSDRSPDVWESSDAARALKQLQANPRISLITLVAPADACPACQQLVGTYSKDQVPALPMEACSHPLGCRAFYTPVIDEIYP
jgi:hypothetical protein